MGRRSSGSLVAQTLATVFRNSPSNRFCEILETSCARLPFIAFAYCYLYTTFAMVSKFLTQQIDHVTDNFRRETVAFVIGSKFVCFHNAILAHCSATASS